MKKIILICLAAILAMLLVFALWTEMYPELAYVKTPSGRRRSESLYLTMDDGVKIAVEYWLPPDYGEGEEIPAMIQATRYSRTSIAPLRDLPFMVKLKARIGAYPDWLVSINQLEYESNMFNEAGYAVVLVDVRGSGASFGERPIEWSPREIEDLGLVMDWVTSQPWSDGNIGAWGMSYTGNTAELMASLNHPALKAVSPGSSDFDPLLGVGMPGGRRTEKIVSLWSELNQSIDEDISHARAVDGDKSGELLEKAYESHNSQNIYKALSGIEYRDDEWGESGYTLGDVSPWGHKEDIERSEIPMYVPSGWLDACVADGSISRFMTFSNPQEVVIGPWGHELGTSCDPLLGEGAQQGETMEEQLAFYEDFFQRRNEQVLLMIGFFDKYLKADGKKAPPKKSITYYTLGEGSWRTTDVWPPRGMVNRTLYLSSQGELLDTKPASPVGEDSYRVDVTATTGDTNRWMTQMGVFVDYSGDRKEEDGKLLTYTSETFANDMMITGTPVVTLYVDSSVEDSTFYAYLEDVDPDGRVTYITEGIIRAIHRAVPKEKKLYSHPGVSRTYKKEDSQPLTPGRVEEIRFNLNSTSALIREGHSLRIALAGHDASVFGERENQGSGKWVVKRTDEYSSRLELPVMTEF